jgi:hypothetical protein
MTRLHWRSGIAAIFGAVVLVGATGCGGDSAEAGSNGGASGGEQMVTINEPAEGASVDVPFTLNLDSSVELGTTESGNHHVHLYFDGDDSKYEVIESESMEITDASPAVDGLKSGEHELNISLRNADHSPAGFETSVMVRVGQEQPQQNDPGTGGGY